MDSVEYKDHRIYYHWQPAHDAPGTFFPLAFIRGPLVPADEEIEIVCPDRRCATQTETKTIAIEEAKERIDKLEQVAKVTKRLLGK
jgi:hypothetical protein